MVMICGECRLVNGQAPPGIKTPEELGRWRCGSCGGWNGVESETTQILTSLRQDTAPTEGSWDSASKADVLDTHSSEGLDDVMAHSEEKQKDVQPRPEPVRRSKRGVQKE